MYADDANIIVTLGSDIEDVKAEISALLIEVIVGRVIVRRAIVERGIVGRVSVGRVIVISLFILQSRNKGSVS